jgi:hypothetical protein
MTESCLPFFIPVDQSKWLRQIQVAEGRGFISGFGTESVIIVHVTGKVKKKGKFALSQDMKKLKDVVLEFL